MYRAFVEISNFCTFDSSSYLTGEPRWLGSSPFLTPFLILEVTAEKNSKSVTVSALVQARPLCKDLRCNLLNRSNVHLLAISVPQNQTHRIIQHELSSPPCNLTSWHRWQVFRESKLN